MTRSELRTAIMRLNEYQVAELSDKVINYLNLNLELQNTYPESCPRCHDPAAFFIKKGIQRGKQRYACKCCGARFTYDTEQITAHSQQPLESWIVVIKDTLAFEPLDATARRIHVCHETAFNMRHKLLAYLEAIVDVAAPMETLVELDETYVIESQKGTPVTHRKPRKHGEGASKRGLSNEQLCVCVGTDRSGHVFAKCVNRAAPSADDLVKALSTHIASESVMLTDGNRCYNKLAECTESKRISLIGHESYDKVYHLNTVNGLHSRFKNMMRQFRGVATCYLNRYAALFSLVASSITRSIEAVADNLRRSLGAMRLYVTINSAESLGLLDI